MIKERNELLDIDLSDLAVEDAALFLEEGSRGLSDFGASCGTAHYPACATSSCAVPEPLPQPTPLPEIPLTY